MHSQHAQLHILCQFGMTCLLCGANMEWDEGQLTRRGLAGIIGQPGMMGVEGGLQGRKEFEGVPT